MNIVFFGTPRFAQIILEKLISSPYKPTLVITSPDAKVGRGQRTTQSPVKQTAILNKIEVLQPEKLSGFTQGPTSRKARGRTFIFDLAILVAYGKIIPKKILAIPKHGFLNVHPSLLPKYRGPSPIQSAILAGEDKTGVTIMKLDQEIDHGPVLGQEEEKISPDDTHDTLAEKLANLGADLLLKVLPDYLNGKLDPIPQDHEKATFTQHIKKQDGYIDLGKPPDAVTFDRMVRAYFPWPGTWSQLTVNGRQLTVKFIPEGKIQPEGKSPMTIKEFLNGYPQTMEMLKRLLKF